MNIPIGWAIVIITLDSIAILGAIGLVIWWFVEGRHL